MLGRYFYFEQNGSNTNGGNHLVEVQIVDKDGVNRASGRGLLRYSYYNTYGKPPSVVTDGNTSYNSYFDFGEGKQYVVIDLGDIYDISYIKVWRYYSGGRIYKDIFIKVSKDDVDYTTVFSSEVDGTYKETSSGYQIDLPEEPDLEPEVTTKYLLRSEGMLCTVADDELVILEETELTADVFHSHGLDELPDWTLLMELTNPEVLYWQESEEDELPVLKATLTAVPVPQTITVPIDLSHPTILGVQKVTTECTGNPLFACSFDDGTTWKVHNGSDWTNGTEMTKDVLEAITTEQWTQAIEGLSSFMLKITLNTTEDTVTKVVIDYINEGE